MTGPSIPKTARAPPPALQASMHTSLLAEPPTLAGHPQPVSSRPRRRVDGDLLRASVGELRRTLDSLAARPQGVRLDLAAVAVDVARRALGSGGLSEFDPRGDFQATLAIASRIWLLRTGRSGGNGACRVLLPTAQVATANGPTSASPIPASIAVASAWLSEIEARAPRAATVYVLRAFGGLNPGASARQVNLSRAEGDAAYLRACAWLAARRSSTRLPPHDAAQPR